MVPHVLVAARRHRRRRRRHSAHAAARSTLATASTANDCPAVSAPAVCSPRRRCRCCCRRSDPAAARPARCRCCIGRAERCAKLGHEKADKFQRLPRERTTHIVCAINQTRKHMLPSGGRRLAGFKLCHSHTRFRREWNILIGCSGQDADLIEQYELRRRPACQACQAHMALWHCERATLTARVDRFQIHARLGATWIAERAGIRRQSAATPSVAYLHHRFGGIRHQASCKVAHICAWASKICG